MCSLVRSFARVVRSFGLVWLNRRHQGAREGADAVCARRRRPEVSSMRSSQSNKQTRTKLQRLATVCCCYSSGCRCCSGARARWCCPSKLTIWGCKISHGFDDGKQMILMMMMMTTGQQSSLFLDDGPAQRPASRPVQGADRDDETCRCFLACSTTTLRNTRGHKGAATATHSLAGSLSQSLV